MIHEGVYVAEGGREGGRGVYVPGGIFVKVFFVHIQSLHNIHLGISVEEGGAEMVPDSGAGLNNGRQLSKNAPGVERRK